MSKIRAFTYPFSNIFLTKNSFREIKTFRLGVCTLDLFTGDMSFSFYTRKAVMFFIAQIIFLLLFLHIIFCVQRKITVPGKEMSYF